MLAFGVFAVILMISRIHIDAFYRGYSFRNNILKRSLKNGKLVKHGLSKGFSDSHNRYAVEIDSKSGLPNPKKPFTVLGIETSCDDTAAAVVTSDGRILSNVIHSQHEIHEKFGGILPAYAMESHKANIDQIVNDAIAKAGLASLADIDAVAVTRGPGLEICLRVGTRKANKISLEHNKPFVDVHHLEAHCLVTRLAGVEIHDESSNGTVIDSINPPKSSSNGNGEASFKPKLEYPFLALLLSGGHTALHLVKGVGDFVALGGGIDDSLGEAFDKAARLVGLPLNRCSGGVAVEKAARNGNPLAVTMALPLRGSKSCDFSYAGLKNSFRVEVMKARYALGLQVETTNAPSESRGEVADVVALPDNVAQDLCASFQHVAFAHVEDRLKRALDYVDELKIPITGVTVVGGVAANLELRRRLLNVLKVRTEKILTLEQYAKNGVAVPHSHSKGLKLVCPPPHLCTDNGVMVAWAGVELLQRGVSHTPEGDTVRPRWPLGTPVSYEAFQNLTRLKQ